MNFTAFSPFFFNEVLLRTQNHGRGSDSVKIRSFPLQLGWWCHFPSEICFETRLHLKAHTHQALHVSSSESPFHFPFCSYPPLVPSDPLCCLPSFPAQPWGGTIPKFSEQPSPENSKMPVSAILNLWKITEWALQPLFVVVVRLFLLLWHLRASKRDITSSRVGVAICRGHCLHEHHLEEVVDTKELWK